ncbi:pumilio protein 8 [Trypanosoma grayi]|uniref:pumilio protein 8 n=1 Tax=Trypanosoma grayi TaxID=71804 RepID=UPI0004F491E8|nr:pumilio protein 8 [Trypanosoma grayi]KEG13213.1 pumilio protein 8 [Trypanosoma grayi]
MVKTNTKREEARSARLQQLPQSERLAKSAMLKKREGRVLNASEKHAMKMSSEYGEIIRLWEVLRVSTDPARDDAAAKSLEERKMDRYEYKYPTVDRLMKLIEPKFATYAKTPRVSRVIQSMIKYASVSQLEHILKLVSEDFAAHATDAYGHFVVVALIRHAPHSLLDKIFSQMIPTVPSLVSHRFGIEVLHAAYSNRLCTATNRHLLILAVLKDSVAVMKRWKGYPVLEEVLQHETAQRKRLLVRLFELCDKLVSQKGAVSFPFVQRLVAAYMNNGTKDEVSELCDTLRPHLATLCTTREGAPLVSLTFSLTEPKKRKEVLRAFSDNLGSLAVGKYSAPVIARLFDLVYDVQLLRKYIVNDVEAHITQLINSPFGHQILLHLLSPHAERKAKFLLPNWFQHNLFSLENDRWNLHTWLTHEYVEETVEICSKSALNTHLAVLPSIVRRFIEVAGDSTAVVKLNKHFTGLIAREVLTVDETEAAYRKALQLSEADKQLLARLAPCKENKRPRSEDADPPASAAPHQKTKARKIDRSSASGALKCGGESNHSGTGTVPRKKDKVVTKKGGKTNEGKVKAVRTK